MTIAAFVAGALFALAIALLIAVPLYRRLESGEAGARIAFAQLLERERQTVETRDARIAELERQIDGLHQQGFTVPVAPQAVIELPEERADPDLEEILAGFDDPDDRGEMAEAAEFVRRARPNASPKEIRASLLEG
jgi:hypothetical protein